MYHSSPGTFLLLFFSLIVFMSHVEVTYSGRNDVSIFYLNCIHFFTVRIELNNALNRHFMPYWLMYYFILNYEHQIRTLNLHVHKGTIS